MTLRLGKMAEKRDRLIENLKQRMEQESDVETLFTIKRRVEWLTK